MLLNQNIKAKNLNSIYFFILGLIFLGMTAWVLYSGDKQPQGINQFDWVYAAVFGIVGLGLLIKGLNTMLRKAYIRVDEEKIAVKPDETTPSETILWRDILSMKLTKINLEIMKTDKSIATIHFTYFEDIHAITLKDSILEMAARKGLKVEIEEITSSKYSN